LRVCLSVLAGLSTGTNGTNALVLVYTVAANNGSSQRQALIMVTNGTNSATLTVIQNAVERVVRRALAKDPDQRFQTALTPITTRRYTNLARESIR
jgi:hypothetical protein